MKGICQRITSIVGGCADYREKTMTLSHDRFTLGLKTYWPKLHLIPLIKVDFQSSV